MNSDSIRVVLVDDDSMILRLMEHHLRSKLGSQIAITATTNPEDVLAINAESNLDMCITDLDMPSMNGFSLLKIIKSKNPLVEVIILTGQPSENAIRSAFAMGASDYLIKPIETELLVATVGFYARRIKRYRTEIFQHNRVEAMA